MAKTPDNIVRLPMPDHLEPDTTARSLMTSVRMYFFALYNAADKTFAKYLGSVGNRDAETGNRLFDRHEAVRMIKNAAKKSEDTQTETAKDGDIYKCIVNLMRKKELGLKLRRRQFRELTHRAPAE
jgi:hypothetical protein